MPLVIPGSEVPIPQPNEGALYGKVHAEEIATNLTNLYVTYIQWEADGNLPAHDGSVLGKEGSFATVYRAGNLACREPELVEDTDHYAKNLVRGIGIDGIEQIVAVGAKRTYSEIVPGNEPRLVSTEDIAALDTPQLNASLDRITAMQARGLALDTKGFNAMVCQKEGIGHVDFRISPRQTVQEKIEYLAGPLLMWANLPNEQLVGPAVVRAELEARLPTVAKLGALVRHRAEYAPDFWGLSVRVMEKAITGAQLTIETRAGR